LALAIERLDDRCLLSAGLAPATGAFTFTLDGTISSPGANQQAHALGLASFGHGKGHLVWW
jgi:hypothetical protein